MAGNPAQQPPNHYRLLGVNVFESDADVIANAADARMAHVRTFQCGKYSTVSQIILNEIATAKVCLLNTKKKCAYDWTLRKNARVAGEACGTTSGRDRVAPHQRIADAFPIGQTRQAVDDMAGMAHRRSGIVGSSCRVVGSSVSARTRTKKWWKKGPSLRK